MGADETQEEQIARHLAGDVHDSDVASDADSSSDDDDDASTSSVEVLSNANGAVPTATAVRFRRRNPKRPNTQSHARYEKYKSATTVQQFSTAAARADSAQRRRQGFAKLGGRAPRLRRRLEPEAPAPKKRGPEPEARPARRSPAKKAPPPAGASGSAAAAAERGDGGANYCDYIIHRHAATLPDRPRAYDGGAPGGVLAALDACYRGFDRIGPTMSKVP
ncbi:hypothetical protein JL720_15835 [Aureococcus anophagefferens]|nr:hypothetical protein JL720_15835 [Aureococcus anophagefferens]